VTQDVGTVACLRSCKILQIQGITAARLGALFDLEYVSHSIRENRGADTGDVEFGRQR
jgi:hypothetical protein